MLQGSPKKNKQKTNNKIHVENYLVIKKNGVQMHSKAWMNLDYITHHKKTEAKDQICLILLI